MKTMTVEQQNRRTARNNALFAKLAPWEKRVAIARDVLAQLEIGRIKATSGTYFHTYIDTVEGVSGINKNAQVQDVLKEVKSCDACALGSVFMCAVEKADKLKISDLVATGYHNSMTINNGDMHDYLKQFFGIAQLYMIENAFESSRMYSSPGFKDPEERKAWNKSPSFNKVVDKAVEKLSADLDYYQVSAVEQEGDRVRMERIMRNIVANRGRFVPSDNTKWDPKRLEAAVVEFEAND